MKSRIDRLFRTPRNSDARPFMLPGWLVALALVGGLSLAPIPASAQDPPLCGEFSPAPGETDNSIKECTDDLLTEQLELINAVDEFLGTMQQVALLLIPQGQRPGFQKQ